MKHWPESQYKQHYRQKGPSPDEKLLIFTILLMTTLPPGTRLQELNVTP
jgi:hypothetical protein